MASTPRNVKVGVCRIYLDGDDMGVTQGGVEVAVTTDTHETKVDQFGDTAINRFIQGRTCTVTAPLAETTLRNMTKVMPGSNLVTDGVQASGGVTYAAQPSAGASVTIAGQAFTLQATKPTGLYQAQIGANLAATLANLAAAINFAGLRRDLGGVKATVRDNGLGIDLAVGDPGVAGNAVTLVGSTGATVSGATFTGGVAETKARVVVSMGVGIDLLSTAKELRLHPINKADNDFSDDFIVHKAATAGALQFAYKLDSERIYNIEWNGYPDSDNGNRLFSVGDPMA